MVVEDQIQLMSQRIGAQRFEALLSRLYDCGSVGDVLRLLRSSEFFRGLVERQIDWLETEAQLKANTIDYITAAHERSTATLQSTEATLTSSASCWRCVASSSAEKRARRYCRYRICGPIPCA